jgi:ubiquinol oxidase
MLHHESQAISLLDPATRQALEAKYAGYRPGLLPRILARHLVFLGNLFYGRQPSLRKFYAVEIIARIPYASWELLSYIAQTAVFSNEQRAIKLGKHSRFSRVAHDNETMHVIVLRSMLTAKECGALRGTLLPLAISAGYFLACALLHTIRPRWAYELNALFEDHAYAQYGDFLVAHEAELKNQPLKSRFLEFYGRTVVSRWEFFCLVRNDELLHKVHSLDLITERT